MKKTHLFFTLVFISITTFGQVNFDDHFFEKTLRFDYIHAGDKESEAYYFDEMIEEQYWGGSKNNLIDTLGLGNNMFELIDIESKNVIYSRGYSTLFREWQTTDEANITKRGIHETVVMPFPKKTSEIVIYSRDRNNSFVERFRYQIDPKNYFIRKDNKHVFDNYQIEYSSEPASALDIVFIPDGYSIVEIEKFISDAERFRDYLFEYEPFKEFRDKINIWAVLAHSIESGIDNPAKGEYKKNIASTSFYTFDSERYVMTYDTKTVRDLAANAPYDQIYILSNSAKYGGGAIYNYYSATTVDHPSSKQVFVHELAHGFAGLADEYFTSDVSYNEFYPTDVEPWEPNITTLVNFDSKWKSLLDEETPVPTPDTDEFENKIGVFEGGGYAAKSVFRSTRNSLMNSFSSNEFNAVCKQVLINTLKFYTQ
ncbi:MAG: IgA Peptidase M64 [Melioribacteraceae bacterium]|nr:IgA Peptidase M64 [Melioribacteraceae bacterium]MCF8264654.1 IgA Peptidase M64 [Melioribacteraceae bacterium]MCF8432008.1 IgA Peptidase M64 [Melioribacteraceae bacterium]